MKKKIFGGIVILAIAIAAAWNVNISSKTNRMSNVKLANVEALAEESSTTPSYNCPGGKNGCVIIQERLGSVKYWKE